MDKEFTIQSINLAHGENLTLQQAEERVEFEALMPAYFAGGGVCADCTVVCGGFNDSPCNPMTTPEPPPVPPPTRVP